MHLGNDLPLHIKGSHSYRWLVHIDLPLPDPFVPKSPVNLHNYAYGSFWAVVWFQLTLVSSLNRGSAMGTPLVSSEQLEQIVHPGALDKQHYPGSCILLQISKQRNRFRRRSTVACLIRIWSRWLVGRMSWWDYHAHIRRHYEWVCRKSKIQTKCDCEPHNKFPKADHYA